MDVNFNAFKVRYELLDHFLNPVIRSRPIKSVTIYVNLDDVFHSLHRPPVNAEFQVEGINSSKRVISNVLNLLGHYRNWACNRRYLDTRIVGVFTSARKYFKNSLYVPNYRRKYMNINGRENTNYYYINDGIFTAMPLLTTIGHYFDGVYLIDSKYLEPSMVPLYLSQNNFNDSDWNIMISRDVYDVQYAYKDKWNLLYPKGDLSNLVTRDNLWDHVSLRERVYKDNREVTLKYDQDLFLTCKSIVGDKYRSIPTLGRIGWITIFKYLDALSKDTISSQAEIQIQLQELLRNKKKVTLTDLNNNRMAVDVDMQCQVINDIEKGIIEADLIDIADSKELQNLNSEFFKEYPINLIFLTQVLRPNFTQQQQMNQRMQNYYN